MIALGFVYFVFTSQLSYIILEQREDFYKDRLFWLIILGLVASIYLTMLMFNIIRI